MLRRILVLSLALLAVSVPAASADVPISGLPAVTSPAGADLTVIVHSGVTSNATLTNLFAHAPAIITTSLIATGNVAVAGGGVLAYPSTFSSPAAPAGAAVFQYNSSSGEIYLGGAVVAGRLNYGVSVGGAAALTRSDNGNYIPLLIGSGSVGSSVGAYAMMLYNPAGTALGITTHAVAGTGSGTFTLTGAAAFTSSSTYFIISGNGTTVTAKPSGSSFTISGGADWIAIGY